MESTEIAVLKEKFSTAQTVFCKKANRLSVAVDIPEKEVFIKDIGELCIEFSRLHDAGWDYIEALGESEDENGEAAQAREKITKCLASCVESLQLARETLWSKYASDEIQLYADSAEKECVETERVKVQGLPVTKFEAMRVSVLKKIHMLEEKVLEWEHLIPGKSTSSKRLLYKLGNRLRDWEKKWKWSNCSTPKKASGGAGVQPTSNASSSEDAPPSDEPTPSKTQNSLVKEVGGPHSGWLGASNPTLHHPIEPGIPKATRAPQAVGTAAALQTGEHSANGEVEDIKASLQLIEHTITSLVKDSIAKQTEDENLTTRDVHPQQAKSSSHLLLANSASSILPIPVDTTAWPQASEHSATSDVHMQEAKSGPAFPLLPRPMNQAEIAEGSDIGKEVPPAKEPAPTEPAVKYTPTKSASETESGDYCGQSEEGPKRPSVAEDSGRQSRKVLSVLGKEETQPWKWPGIKFENPVHPRCSGSPTRSELNAQRSRAVETWLGGNSQVQPPLMFKAPGTIAYLCLADAWLGENDQALALSKLEAPGTIVQDGQVIDVWLGGNSQASAHAKWEARPLYGTFISMNQKEEAWLGDYSQALAYSKWEAKPPSNASIQDPALPKWEVKPCRPADKWATTSTFLALEVENGIICYSAATSLDVLAVQIRRHHLKETLVVLAKRPIPGADCGPSKSRLTRSVQSEGNYGNYLAQVGSKRSGNRRGFKDGVLLAFLLLALLLAFLLPALLSAFLLVFLLPALLLAFLRPAFLLPLLLVFLLPALLLAALLLPWQVAKIRKICAANGS
ncbi:uncharacterized protein LOC134464998 [Engraulis encrasicolus]|uniref:uncharacterized protein LOC134464998 n=1 Tax=Engraulis encrasicolus TaxID=184585 RepID=UPI002FCFFF11